MYIYIYMYICIYVYIHILIQLYNIQYVSQWGPIRIRQGGLLGSRDPCTIARPAGLRSLGASPVTGNKHPLGGCEILHQKRG